jgi:hypothetical protein
MTITHKISGLTEITAEFESIVPYFKIMRNLRKRKNPIPAGGLALL